MQSSRNYWIFLLFFFFTFVHPAAGLGRPAGQGFHRPERIVGRRQSDVVEVGQESLAYQQEQETLPAAAIPLTNGTESVRSSGRSKTPPPRPPPPVFRQPEPVTTPLASSADWSCGRSDTPPSLQERDDWDFVMDQVSSSSSASPTPLAPVMTDVVEITTTRNRPRTAKLSGDGPSSH